MAGAEEPVHLDLEGGVFGQAAGGFVEPELVDEVGADDVLGWFQNIVVLAGDVGNEGETVGAVGLDGVSANIGGYPFQGITAQAAVSAERVDRNMAALVVGGQEEFAGSVEG